MTYLLIAIALSVMLIVLLWHGDSKRRRTAGLADLGHGPLRRRAMLAAALLPGFGLALSGDSSAFLVWFGVCAVAGWLIAQLQPRRVEEERGRRG